MRWCFCAGVLPLDRSGNADAGLHQPIQKGIEILVLRLAPAAEDGGEEGAIFYELQNGDGQPAIRNGFIGFE